MTDKKHRAKLYGLDSEIKYLGQTIGPLIGGWILLWFGFKGIVNFYVISLIIGIFLLLFFIKKTNHRTTKKIITSTIKASYISELKELRLFGLGGALLFFFSLLFTSWEQILWTFEPLFYGPDVLNIPPTMGGLLLALFSLPGIFFSYLIGKIADKLGKELILFLGLLVMGCSLISFSGISNIYLIFISALFISIGWVSSLVSLNALIADLSYKHRKGEIVGIWNFFMDIGFFLGPIFGGFIAEIFGIRNLFSIIGILFLISSLLTIFIKKLRILSITNNTP